MISVLISARPGSAASSVSIVICSSSALPRAQIQPASKRVSSLAAARKASWMRCGRAAEAGFIKRDHEIRTCRRRETLFHERPRLKIVRQGNCAKIMPQRGADPRRRCLHGRDSGAHRDVDVPPARFTFIDRLENGRRQLRNSGIAAETKATWRPSSAKRKAWRARSNSAPCRFGGASARFEREPLEIGAVADKISRIRMRPMLRG